MAHLNFMLKQKFIFLQSTTCLDVKAIHVIPKGNMDLYPFHYVNTLYNGTVAFKIGSPR